MNTRTLSALATAAFVMTGCGAASSQPRAPRGDANVVTAEQLVATNSVSLYDAIEKLRPEWLSSRGPTSVTDASPTVANVFMNGQQLGSAQYLREMRVSDVSEARFWPPGQASARFGMGHLRGVIELKPRT